MEVELDPVGDSRWLQLLSRAPEASIFHHPAWLRLLQATYGYELRACCLGGPDGMLLGGVPVATVSSRITGSRLVALPFSDLCPPLIASGAPHGAAAVLARALEAFGQLRGLPLEVRGTGQVLREPRRANGSTIMCSRSRPTPRRSNAVSPRRRRCAASAAHDARACVPNCGLIAMRSPGSTGCTSRHVAASGCRLSRAGSFSASPSSSIKAWGSSCAYAARDRLIAAAVFLTSHDVLTYKYGASDARFLATRPNNLLFMEAIRWGCDNGYRSLDFGRTHWGQEGLRAFKLAWGSEERELRYRYLGGPLPRARDARVASTLAAGHPPEPAGGEPPDR